MDNTDKITLEDEDRDAFLETLKKPPPPNEKLILLFKTYHEMSTSTFLNGFYG